MPFTEDFAQYFDTDEFGTEASFTTPNLGAVNGIFDDEYEQIDFNHHSVDGSNPTFLCTTANITGVGEGSAVTINATNYTVKDRQDDGTGTSMLILRTD